MNISATIVIYDEDYDTLQNVLGCFSKIRLKKELIVVDNSPDNRLKELVDGFEDTSYIFSGKNLGFGAGHNLGFKNLKSDSDIYMVINPDITFDADEITLMIEWFFKADDIALLVPKVLNLDGSVQYICRDIPTFKSLFIRKFNFNNIFEKSIVKDELDRVCFTDVTDIPFCHGCFMLFKTDVYKKLSGFDERFFLYMEDVDILIRAKLFGKTAVNPYFKIYHEHRKGSSKSFKLLYFHIVSALKFFWKYR